MNSTCQVNCWNRFDASNLQVRVEMNRKPASHILWIDGVGGYLLLDRDEVLIGQAGGLVDIGIVGDVSRQACVIRRRQADYFAQPLQEMHVDGKLVSELCLLRATSRLQIGKRVELNFVKPHPLSSTARIELAGLHRFQPRVDGVLLLADSCVLGPSGSSHVRCSQWSQDLLVYRQGDRWFFRSVAPIDADGHKTNEPVLLTAGLRLRGEDFSLSIE